MYYEGKVRFAKIDKNGKDKIVKLPCLVDSDSIYEALERFTNEFNQCFPSGFKIFELKESKISEVHRDELQDQFHQVEVKLMSIDEKSGKEKETSIKMLFESNSTKIAESKCHELMSDSISDYKIHKVISSNIFDVIEVDNYNDEIF